MIINDTRHFKYEVKLKDLQQGEVYIDVYGNYVMATDEYKVVNLFDGTITPHADYEGVSEDGMFTPVKARLEIE